MKLTSILAKVCLASVLSAVSASAFPIAVGGEGSSVIANGTVTATYQGNSASYNNLLYLERDAFGNPGQDGNQANDLPIFDNYLSAVGNTLVLGTFASGTELIFRLHVNNTGYDYYTGPASRNPDNLAHARVEGNWTSPGITLISFEDLYGTPEYPQGFNDMSFSFENTVTTTTPPSVPDAGNTLVLLGGAMVGLLAAGNRFRRANA